LQVSFTLSTLRDLVGQTGTRDNIQLQMTYSEISNDPVQNSVLPFSMRSATAKTGSKILVGPIDLTIGQKGLTIVMGPNGSGKTTLLRLMHGLHRLASGEIQWNLPAQITRERQAYVFQNPIMMRRSVVDCIAFPLILHGLGRKAARQKASEWACRFGMANMLDRAAPDLSGGEKQKLSLVRALIRKPDILFLDEPCANLDGRSIREIEKILLDVKAQGTRIVMATHDMGQAKRLASEVVFMLNGKIHEIGPAKPFFNHPKTAEAAGFINGEIVE